MRSPGPAEGDCFAVWKPGGSLPLPLALPGPSWPSRWRRRREGRLGTPHAPGWRWDSCLGRGRKSAGLGDGRDASASDLTAALSVRVGRTVPSAGHAGTVCLPAERASVSQEREAC